MEVLFLHSLQIALSFFLSLSNYTASCPDDFCLNRLHWYFVLTKLRGIA